MHIVCISASNIRHARDRSTSLRICHLIQQIANEKSNDLTTEETIQWYKGQVLDTIANALSWPVEMKIAKIEVATLFG